jgi:hypothetical protein
MRIEFEVPDEVLHRLLDGVPMPDMAYLHYEMQTPPPLTDIAREVHDQIARAGGPSLVRPGEQVAIAVGSRGIGQLQAIVSALVAALRTLGADPFIIPAMGSHGGATAEGQREVLRHLGITEELVGARVEAQMQTVEVGRTPQNVPVRLDRLALSAHGIVFVGRIKPHTAFRGEYESGLAKMIAIGLGKQAGAANCHAAGFGEMSLRVPAIAEVALARAPIRFGLAVLENAHDLPFKIVCVPADRILSDEPALLAEARQVMPRIPLDRFDVLVIDEIGKHISGDGADPNITGRYPTPFASGGPEVNKQVILDLGDASDGNANGVGSADFTTVRLARKMDFGRTYPNALTSTVARPVGLPMILPSDRLAIAAALLTCNAVDHAPQVVRIRNTAYLEHFSVSASLLGELRRNSAITEYGTPAQPAFDQDGNLTDLGFPREYAARALAASSPND